MEGEIYEKMDLRVKRALKFIEENLDKDLTLKKLAKQFNLNYSYLCELFKREIGMSFSEYLTKIKIKRAKKLLKDKSLLIKEISYEVGYKYPANFSRDFKRITKLWPEEYREIIKKYRFFPIYNAVILIRKFANSIQRFANKIRKIANKKWLTMK